MENNKQPEEPKYIKDLMRPTPSGIAKLIAAWHGLSTETQILVLSKLNETSAHAYLAEKVRINALDSENAYVRYLAARKFYFSNNCSDEEKLLKEKIENDPVSLVKYSLLESSGSSVILDDSFKDADTFFALPHEARLAKIREVDGYGEEIAALLSQAADKHLKDGKVSEMELYEILVDYLDKPEFHDYYTDTRVTYDGYGEYTKGKDIESLWRLVPRLPDISHILIKKLPEASGSSSKIPKDVIDSMTDRQLETLLFRKDIGLQKFRKKLFLEISEDRDGIRSAAISSHFNMEYDEFAKILSKPSKERVSILKELGTMASQLSLCFYDAIHDALFASDTSPFDFEYAIFARDALEERIRDLDGWQREKELTELRLYRLAKQAAPWDSRKGYAPSGVLEFLAEKIVPDDTWATFMGFSEVWSRKSYRVKDLNKYLPGIEEIDEDEYELEESETDPSEDTNVELIKSIDVKLAELQQVVKLSDNLDNKKLLEGLGEVRKHATELNNITQNQASGLQAELRRIKSSLNRQRFLLYAVLGLVLWLLLI